MRTTVQLAPAHPTPAPGRRFAPAIALCAIAALALAPTAEAKKPRASFSQGVLTVEGSDRDDRIFVYCTPGLDVEVNGTPPRGGRVPCARVREVDVDAMAGDDLIDMTGVGKRFGDARFEGFGTGTAVVVKGGAGDDTLIGSRVAFNIFAGFKGADTAGGGKRRDLLIGGKGPDTLRGFRGNDVLYGNQKRDRLFGGKGNDRLFGGKDHDLLRPGPGRDRVVQ